MFINAPLKGIFVTLLLYALQGFVLGLSTTIPIYIRAISKQWKEQGIYSLVHYPFSIKLLWAPIIDVFFIKRLGRRQTWLLPIQVILGIGLIVFSFYIESWIDHLHIISLSITMFFILFLTATQDVCVDGWALTLFSTTNVIWQSTSQTIGQTLGRFLGSSFLLTFESTNFTNQYIRRPLSLPAQNTGLFTLGAVVRFWGISFLVVTCFIAFIFRERITEKVDEEKKLKFFHTYISVIKLFKKRCMLELAYILIISPFGYAATYFLTSLALTDNGMSRDTLGLITMPIIVVKLIVPLILTRTTRPLTWFARLYLPRLFTCVLISIVVFFTTQLIQYPFVFYPVLIALFIINEAIIYLQLVARVGFYAQISEPRIGGTYMTLVSTLGNIGQTVSNTAVTFIAGQLPKKSSYIIEVAGCTVIGIIWLVSSWRMMHRLQALPVRKWYTVKDKSETSDDTRTDDLSSAMSTTRIDMSPATN